MLKALYQLHHLAFSALCIATRMLGVFDIAIRVYEKLAAASKHYSAKQGVHSLVLSGTPCESQEHLAQFLFSGSSSVTKSLVNSIHNALLKL